MKFREYIIEKISDIEHSLMFKLYDIIYDQTFVDNDKKTRNGLEKIFNLKYEEIEDIWLSVHKKYRSAVGKIKAEKLLDAFRNVGFSDNISKHKKMIEKLYFGDRS